MINNWPKELIMSKLHDSSDRHIYETLTYDDYVSLTGILDVYRRMVHENIMNSGLGDIYHRREHLRNLSVRLYRTRTLAYMLEKAGEK